MKAAKLFLFTLIVVTTACDRELETPPEVVITGEVVDLRAQQTPIRNQGNRTTCIAFASVAALEASYMRLGYGAMQLSPEFVNYLGKTLWLHPDWDDILARGDDGAESQVGAFGGGNGGGYIYDMWTRGLKVPLNEVMPYKTENYSTENDPTLMDDDWQSTVYQKQRNMSNFNLDSTKLSYDVLHADEYFGVGLAKWHDDATKASDPEFIEQILRRKLEVVWDFTGSVPWDAGGTDARNVWVPCSSCDIMAHSMLIVGFDKSDPDPDNHFFIVKNSWGSSWTATSDNFTLISYDYLRQYGRTVAYVEIPLLDPKPWEELKFMGRWRLVFDGHEGELDIYHLPGYWSDRSVADNRIGSFYDNQGNAFKVNGSIEGNKIVFYIDGENPNQRWEVLSGRKFEYYLSDEDFMSGFHTDPGGGMFGGYARKAGKFDGGVTTPRPFLPSSYEQSAWSLKVDNRSGTVQLNNIAPYEGEFPEFYDIFGTFTDEQGDESSFMMRIPQTEYSHFYMQFFLDGEAHSLEGRHLNHTPGNIAGYTTGTGIKRPFIMIRQ